MIIFLIVSSVFLVFGLLLGLNYFYFKANAKTLPGRIHAIERYQSRQNRKTSTYYRPLIEYAFKGENYVFTSNFGSSDIGWNIGQKVQVYSLDKGPEYVRLKAKIHYLFPLIFFIFGFAGSAFYFYHHHSSLIIGVYATAMILAPIFAYQYLKSKNLVEKFIQELLKNKIETPKSLEEREIFFDKASLSEHAEKNHKVAFFITLFFATGTSTALHFTWAKTKQSSKDFIYSLAEDLSRVEEIKNYMNDKSLAVSLVLAFFTSMLLYSLLYQVITKKK